MDIEKHIVTTFGGSEALYCCIMGLVNEGEEVIIFDPAYDVYRPQVQMAGGKTIGIQLRPKKRVYLLIFSTRRQSLLKDLRKSPLRPLKRTSGISTGINLSKLSMKKLRF